jgi:hypothetical protein
MSGFRGVELLHVVLAQDKEAAFSTFQHQIRS